MFTDEFLEELIDLAFSQGLQKKTCKFTKYANVIHFEGYAEFIKYGHKFYVPRISALGTEQGMDKYAELSFILEPINRSGEEECQ